MTSSWFFLSTLNVSKIYATALAALFIEILATLRRTTHDKHRPKNDSLQSDEICKDLNTKRPESDILIYHTHIRPRWSKFKGREIKKFRKKFNALCTYYILHVKFRIFYVAII